VPGEGPGVDCMEEGVEVGHMFRLCDRPKYFLILCGPARVGL
jgi:hypothetical protein